MYFGGLLLGWSQGRLNYVLGQYSICNFYEIGDICVVYVVGLFCFVVVLYVSVVDIQYDVMQVGIYFFCFLVYVCGVLCYFQIGSCYVVGVGCFVWGKQYVSFQEQVGCGDGGWYVGVFCYGFDVIGNQLVGGIDVQFVLGCVRQGNIYWY